MPEPFIIAEIAQGFEGKPAQAMSLVSAAAAAGADAAKLQLVYADELATPDYKHYELFRKLEMADAVWRELAAQARDLRIALFLDVYGPRSLALAQAVGVTTVKIHSTDMSNPGLLQAVAASAIAEILLSTGGCTASEIEHAIDRLGGKRLVLLHGFQGYPTPTEANQIRRLQEFAARYGKRAGLRFGFADHADPESPLSLLLAAAALGAGATVIEKHLTLARAMRLEDHESALNPDEFASFVRQMRNCAAALGTPVAAEDFGMHDAERGYRDMTHKHVVAARDLPAGTVLVAADLALKRTASAAFLHSAGEAVGRRLRIATRRDQAIGPDMLEAPA